MGEVGGPVADGSRQAENRSRSGQGAIELGFPGSTLGQMQREAACRASEPSGEGEEPSPQGLGGYYLLAQTDARCPASEVMRHHLHRQLRF